MKPALLLLLAASASLVGCIPDHVSGHANGQKGALAFWNDDEVPLRTAPIGAPVDVKVERFEGGFRTCSLNGNQCSDVPAKRLRKLVAQCDLGCDVVTSETEEVGSAEGHRGRVRIIGRAPTARLTVDVVTDDGQALSDSVDLTFARADEIRVGRADSNGIGIHDAMLVGASIDLELAAYAAGERLTVADDAWTTTPEGKAISVEREGSGAHLVARAAGKARVSFALADLSRRFDLRVVDPSEIASAEIWRLADEDLADGIASWKVTFPSATADLLEGGSAVDALSLDASKPDDATYALVLTTMDGARVLGGAPLLTLESGRSDVANISFFGRDVSDDAARRSTPTFTVGVAGEGHDAIRLDLGGAHLEVPVAVTHSH